MSKQIDYNMAKKERPQRTSRSKERVPSGRLANQILKAKRKSEGKLSTGIIGKRIENVKKIENSGQYGSNPHLVNRNKERNEYVEKYLNRLDGEKKLGVRRKVRSSRVSKQISENVAGKFDYIPTDRNKANFFMREERSSVHQISRSKIINFAEHKKRSAISKEINHKLLKKPDRRDSNPKNGIIDVEKKIKELDKNKRRILNRMNLSSPSLSPSPSPLESNIMDDSRPSHKQRYSEVPNLGKVGSEPFTP